MKPKGYYYIIVTKSEKYNLSCIAHKKKRFEHLKDARNFVKNKNLTIFKVYISTDSGDIINFLEIA